MLDFLFANAKPFSTDKIKTAPSQNAAAIPYLPGAGAVCVTAATSTPPPAVPPAAPSQRKSRNLTPNASLSYGQWTTKYCDRKQI